MFFNLLFITPHKTMSDAHTDAEPQEARPTAALRDPGPFPHLGLS